MTKLVPVNEPLLDGREKDYVIECLDTGWISSEGTFVERFEKQFAARVGRNFGIAVCNGTAALEATVAALGIGPGDEVILPTFTIISCAAAIVRAGATPVLVDSDHQTWNMDANQVTDKITPRTRAIMAVHIYGLPVDMEPLLALAQKHGLHIIEDAAEMIGQTYNGRPCGSFGDISTFSFYSNKHVTTGEGGMIVTDDEALAHKCRSLRNLCFQPEKRFVHNDLGWNMRITNLQAAIGLAQLERLDQHIDRKRSMGRRYTELLEKTPGLQLPLAVTNYAENIYWVYGVMLEEQVAFDAREAMNKLSQLDIATRPFFWPMHQQPVFRRMGLFRAASFPVAERMARRGFYVPSGLALSDQQMEQTVSALEEIMS
jgi:perosamine synthetase